VRRDEKKINADKIKKNFATCLLNATRVVLELARLDVQLVLQRLLDAVDEAHKHAVSRLEDGRLG